MWFQTFLLMRSLLLLSISCSGCSKTSGVHLYHLDGIIINCHLCNQILFCYECVDIQLKNFCQHDQLQGHFRLHFRNQRDRQWSEFEVDLFLDFLSFFSLFSDKDQEKVYLVTLAGNVWSYLFQKFISNTKLKAHLN